VKARVIAPKENLPPLAQMYSGKVGEIVEAPPGRDLPDDVYWLKFANSKVSWFLYTEIEIEDESLPKTILVPIGEDEQGEIAYVELPNPEVNCEVIYYGLEG
jgi:hypothetical protein